MNCFPRAYGINLLPCFNSIDWNNASIDTPYFSFENQTKRAKVVKVYDGDTVKIVFPIRKKLFKFSCRLIGIDTPEMKSHDHNEKSYAHFVQKQLSKKILNKIVTVKCGKFDKYGRLLITIYHNNSIISVNKWLIEKKYALPYDGGTKNSWANHLKLNDELLIQIVGTSSL
jgi:endonuclease YncB( thermonuclease family)